MVGTRFCLAAALAVMTVIHTEATVRKVTLDAVGRELKSASPGDTLVVSPGEYSDLEMRWKGCGLPDAPVVVIAEEEGKTVITGKSALKISGRGLVVSSLLFRNGTPVRNKGALIEFRDGDSLAVGCRLTNCAVDSYNAVRRDFPSSYVHLYGRENRVDHCSFTGKKSLGVTLIVMLNYDGCIDNGHSIDHNYFGYRPVYGSNGAETIRVGTSQQCMQPSRTTISDNVFYRCNGEVEVISIKSCENIIRNNVLYECEGVAALRHGDRNLAEGNIFIGNGVRNTGGIRIVGEGQIVRNNRFFGLAGQRFFSALALMNAVPNSLPNRYMQVRDILVEGNDFVDCASIEFGTGNDFERTLAPENVIFRGNSIYNISLEEPYCALSDISGISFSGNTAVIGGKSGLPEGFRGKTHKRAPECPDFRSLSAGKGAAWFAVPSPCDAVERSYVEVGGESELYSAVVSARPGTHIVLTAPLYVLDRGLEIGTSVTIEAKDGISPEFRYAGKRSENMLTICDGADLTVKGITFNGVLSSGRSLAKAGISTASDMLDVYRLHVEGCSFINFGEGGFIPVRGTSGTFAERVEIRNCHFGSLSGDAINYAAELDDKGRYNADDIIIENCTFERILGLPVNIYRGGSDESTAGPYVYVRNCRFDDCCNKVRGSVIRIIGAQVLRITGCEFYGSGRGGYSIRLDDAPWEDLKVEGNTFSNSGGIMSNRKIEL